jgi:hypothetical protein
MKHRDIMNAMGDVDFDLVEDAGRVTRKTSIRRKVTRWSSLAACVCVVLVGAILLLQLRDQRVDIIDHSASQWENLWVPNADMAIGNGQINEGNECIPPPSYSFGPDKFIVVAKVAEVLPAVYIDVDFENSGTMQHQQYHVLRLQVLDAFCTENMPDEIYLRIRANLDPSLDEYDCLVIGGMSQVGYEDYIMINADQKKAESFSLLFECRRYSDNGAILPYKDGVLFLEHWKKDGWLDWCSSNWEFFYHFATAGWGSGDFPAWEGCTVQDTVQTIKEAHNYYHSESPSRHPIKNVESINEILVTEEQKKILEYVKSPDNGLFMQEQNSAYYSRVYYIRNIGGFLTNERVIMKSDGRIQRYGEQFSKEDIARIQDLGSFVNSLDIASLVPPPTDNYEQMELYGRHLTGKYVKHEGKVYGVVRILWELLQQEGQDQYMYYDDLYYLILPDGSIRRMERDELLEYIGEDGILYAWYEYGVGARWWHW